MAGPFTCLLKTVVFYFVSSIGRPSAIDTTNQLAIILRDPPREAEARHENGAAD